MNNKSKYNSSEYLNKKYNKLYTLEYIASNDDRNTLGEPAYICRCDCGNITIKRVKQVINGIAKACGNCRIAPNHKYYNQEYIGQTFNGLTVIDIKKENKKLIGNADVIYVKNIMKSGYQHMV